MMYMLQIAAIEREGLRELEGEGEVVYIPWFTPKCN